MPRNVRSRLGFEMYVSNRTAPGLQAVHRGFSGLMSGVSREAGMASQAIGGALMGNATLAAATAGAAVVGFAANSQAAFVDMERQWAEVTTLMPQSTKAATDAMLADIREFSKQSGFIIQDSIEATYQSLSAGLEQHAVPGFMETAGDLARAAVTDLATSVDAITSVLNAYNLEVSEADDVSDALFTTIQLGKTRLEEIAPALGPVLPLAAAMNTEFTELTGALAALTAQGSPTSIAMTQIRSALTALSKEGEARNIFTSLTGMSYTEYQAGGGTLIEALTMIVREAERTGKEVVDVFGRVEAANAALALTSEKTADTFAGSMDDIEGAVADAAAKQELTAAHMHDQLKAQLNDVRLTVGSMITTLTGFALEALGIVDTTTVGVVNRSIQAAREIAEGQRVTAIGQWWQHPEAVIRLWETPKSELSNVEVLAKSDVMENYTARDIMAIRELLGMPVGPSDADIAAAAGGITGAGNPYVLMRQGYAEWAAGEDARRVAQRLAVQSNLDAGPYSGGGLNPAQTRGVGRNRDITWGEREEIPWGSQMNEAWRRFMASQDSSTGATGRLTKSVDELREVLEEQLEEQRKWLVAPADAPVIPEHIRAADPRFTSRRVSNVLAGGRL